MLISSSPGLRGFNPILNNQDPYPCASNIPVKCTFLIGWLDTYAKIYVQDRIMVEFLDLSYASKPFHIIFPDTNIGSTKRFYYQLGFYNLLTKDWNFIYMGTFSRDSIYWVSTPTNITATLSADVTGKAGSYRNNVRLSVANPGAILDLSFIILSTQWSFF